MRNALGILKLLSQGEEDMKSGKTLSREQVFEKLEDRIRGKGKILSHSMDGKNRKRLARHCELYCERSSFKCLKDITENKKGHFASLPRHNSESDDFRATRTGSVAIQGTHHFSLASHV